MRMLELKIPPPLAAALMGLAMWAAGRAMPAVNIDATVRLPIALLCALFGVTVAVSGFSAFRRAGTTVSPTNPDGASAVVTGGIFRYTRNPMYLGLTSVLTGWAVWLSVPWLLLGPIVFVLFITRFQILPEERVMSSNFGRDYDDYRKRVRRWL